MSKRTNWRTTLLERQRWLVFLLPFLVFMLIGALEPTPDEPGGKALGLAIPYAFYPWLYTIKIALTLAAVVFVLPGYREFPWRGCEKMGTGSEPTYAIPAKSVSGEVPVPIFSPRSVSPLAIIVGVVGGPLWIVLCNLNFEHAYLLPLLEKVGLGWFVGSGVRAAFNPFEQLAGQPAWAGAFLAVRFLGLVAVVPLVEELFLRGFLMRFVIEREWWDVPFGKVNKLAIALGTIVPMMSHPELLAAAVWFSMITWLMLRTRNLWDCVAAHALTNLILGLYVVWAGAWKLM
jgi:hypothetical protein